MIFPFAVVSWTTMPRHWRPISVSVLKPGASGFSPGISSRMTLPVLFLALISAGIRMCSSSATPSWSSVVERNFAISASAFPSGNLLSGKRLSMRLKSAS